ncbi:MAG: DUF4304 domain-containing protein [Clostridiales bacterium]|nr:DUF4304 domain-containing protein [Clostridiales bacterium]
MWKLSKFKLKGTRKYFRSDLEMQRLDREAADEAYKEKKKILDDYMISKGFFKHKTNTYIRLNKINVLESVNLQKERYGSRTFTVNILLMPMYLPQDSVPFGGERISYFIGSPDVWWDFGDSKAAETSFENIVEAVDRFVMPWFEKTSDPECLKSMVQEHKVPGQFTNNDYIKWNEVFDSYNDQDDVVLENISRMKLPKALIKGRSAT